MNSKSLLLPLLIAVCLFLPLSLTAAEYTVGPGGAYENLEALRMATGVLKDGDTIILNGDDNSLRGSFTTTLTLQGSGVITPVSSVRFLNAPGKDITIDSNSMEFRNFVSSDRAGAIYARNITLSGGTNTFTGNTGRWGGAICAYDNATLRATDGDFTFRGNISGGVSAAQQANSIYMQNYANNCTLTLAAEEGQNIYLYDPITSNNATNTRNFTTNINPLATDTGRIVFDGSDYTREVDRHSDVYGNTTVGNGTLALQGNVIYGGATYGGVSNAGTFTLGQNATLLTDASTNRIQANTITMNGAVGINSGGTLELAAAQGVNFNGTMYVGLGLDDFTSGMISVLGNLTFGNNAMLDLYWGDSSVPTENWKQTYDMSALFTATGSMNGFDKLMFDMSAFTDTGFNWSWDNSILMLSYTAAEVPEPATLLVLGLGLAGLPVVRRLRRG